MPAEDEYLGKNEFSELIQHLTLEEVLTIEFLIDTVWRKLISQVDKVKTLFQCNLCNVVQSGMKNLYSHLDGKRHKAQLGKVLRLYHSNYTHPKSTVNKNSHGSKLQQSQSKAPTVGKTAIQMNKNVSSTSSNKTSHTTPSSSKPPDSSVNKSTAKVSQQSNTVVTETLPVVRIKTEPKDDDEVEDSDNINATDCNNLSMSANKNVHGNENINNVKVTAATLKATSSSTNTSAPETAKPIKLGSCTVRIQRLPTNVSYKSTPNNAGATKPSQSKTAKAVKAATIKNSSENMAAKKSPTKDSPESIINTPLTKKIKQEKPDSIDEKRDNQSPQTAKNQKAKCNSNNTATKTTPNKGSLAQPKSNSDEMNKTQKRSAINCSPKKSGASQIDKSLNEGEDSQNSKDANKRNNLKSAENESIEKANTVGGDDANVIKKSNPNENKEKLMTSYKIPVLQGRISVKPVSQLVKNPFALMDQNNANDDDGDSNKEKGENKNEPSPRKVIEVRDSPQISKHQSLPEEGHGNKRSHDNDNTDEPPSQKGWVKSIVLNPAAAYVEKEQNKTNIQYETNKIIVPTKHKSKAGSSAPGNNQPNFTTKSFTCSRADDGEIHGLLGVEYVIKILKSRDDISPRYECGLCELVLDGFAMQKHLEGYNHRLKYCEKHFPTAVRHYRQYLTNVPPYETYKVMTPILSKLAVAIEKHYGRNLPQECLERDFNTNRHDVLGKAFSHRHACEQYGPSFTHILDSKEIDKFISDRHLYKPQVTTHGAIFDKRASNMSEYRHSGGGNRNDRDREVSSRRDRHRYSDRDIASHSRPSVRHSATAATTSYASALDNTALDPVDDETHRRMVESFLKGTLKKSTSDRHVFRRSSRDRKRSASPVSSSYVGYGGATKRTNLSPVRKNDVWWEYRLRIDEKLKELDDKYRGYRNDPENHPMYNEEWQKFWKRRKDELITAGLDHRKYNYQPEWVRFFKVRVKELFTQEMENMKIKLREKMRLPMTNDYLGDPTYHVQVPKRSSPNPLNNSILMNTFQSQNIPSNTMAAASGVCNSAPHVVSVLRLMTALEEHLGSLGPKITNLLSKALQTEKFNPQNVNSIILTGENWSLIETAKEKFKGLVLAGIYDGSKQRALHKVIEEAESLLGYAEKLRINHPIGPQSTILNNFNQAPVATPILPLQTTNATMQSASAVRSGSGLATAESNLNSSFLRSAAQAAFEHQSPSNYQATNMRSSLIEQSTTLSDSSPRTQLSLDKEDLSAKLALILSTQSKTDFDPDTIQKLGAIVNMIEKKKREGHTISAKKKSLSDMLTDLLKNASARNEVTTEQNITLDEPLSSRQTAAVPTPNVNMTNMTNTLVSGGRLSTANINSSYHNKPSTSSSGEKTFSGGNYYNTTTTSTNLNNSNSNAGGPSGRFVYNNNAPNNLTGYQPQPPTQQPQRFPINSGPYNNGPYQANNTNANQYQAAWNMNYVRPQANAMGGSGIPRDNVPPWQRY